MLGVDRLTLSEVLVAGRPVLVEGKVLRLELTETPSDVLDNGRESTLVLSSVDEPLGNRFTVAEAPAPSVPDSPRPRPNVALALNPEDPRPRPRLTDALADSEAPAVIEACAFRIVLEEGPDNPRPPLAPAPGVAVITATTQALSGSPPFVHVLMEAETMLEGRFADTPVIPAPTPTLPDGKALAT